MHPTPPLPLSPQHPESEGLAGPGLPLTVIALILAEPILAPQEVQGGVQVRVYLVNAVPDGLQGGPPVGGLGLLLAPERGGQEEDDDEGERGPREQGHPRSTGPCPHGAHGAP